MKVIVLSGCSGSGKSTYIRRNYPGAKVVSADHYFTRGGVYAFDPSKLTEAHATCFRAFLDAMQSKCAEIVVDNTSTTEAEIAPYMLGALAFGYEVQIVTLVHSLNKDAPVDAFVEMCTKRNQHGVPADSIYKQYMRILNRRLPTYWSTKFVLGHS